MSVYLAALLILWMAVIAGILALVRRFFDEDNDPAPVSRYGTRPRQRKAA